MTIDNNIRWSLRDIIADDLILVECVGSDFPAFYNPTNTTKSDLVLTTFNFLPNYIVKPGRSTPSDNEMMVIDAAIDSI